MSKTKVPGTKYPVLGYAERTIAAYRAHARKAIRNWSRGKPSRFLRRFAAGLPRGARVLDYGCGAGREMAWLRSRGLIVEGIDGTLEFVLAARRRCPGVRVLHARFETVSLPPGRYDGIWCNAALIHVPPPELARQLWKLAAALKSGGLLGLTLAWGRSKRFLRRDWIPGRYMACYSRAEVEAFLKEGWEIRSLKVVSNEGRRGRWICAMLESRRARS